MPRKSTGSVVEKRNADGDVISYGIRFRAHGRRQYVTVGRTADGVTREDAERELAYALEQVRRGDWNAPVVAEAPREVPTFHVFASAWFEARKIEGGRDGRGLGPRAVEDLEWRLCNHLLPAFAHKRLDEITVEDVDRYRRAKVAAGSLGPSSVNKTLTTLAAILEQAVEYGHVQRNVAAGRRRRLPTKKPRRTFLARADHIAALLDAAGDLDRERRTRPYRRALVATLMLGGLRIDEALTTRWRDVDLAAGRLRVPGTKTLAAARVIDLLPALRDELATHATQGRSRDELVFGTTSGAKQSPSNVRNRILAPAVERANATLADRDVEPLPAGLTPHSLRRTFASLLYVLGCSQPECMRAMGHTSAALTLEVYAQPIDRQQAAEIRALVLGADWAPAGTEGVQMVHEAPRRWVA